MAQYQVGMLCIVTQRPAEYSGPVLGGDHTVAQYQVGILCLVTQCPANILTQFQVGTMYRDPISIGVTQYSKHGA